MELGVQSQALLEFELFKNKYSLDDCIIGTLLFKRVNMRIKSIEIQLIKVESIGHGKYMLTIAQKYKSDTQVITKFEIIDGRPGTDEIIPVRMFLDSLENLSPTYKDLNNIISIRYFIKLVLIDEDDRNFSKQQEIYLWRSNL
jgi:vacuolar protein sorting-associated protein 26